MNPPPHRPAASTAYNVEGLALASSPKQSARPAAEASPSEGLRVISPAVRLLAEEEDAHPQFRWETRFMANLAAGANARLRTRPRLTVARWHGDVELASRVAAQLVANGAEHGLPFRDGTVGLRLMIGQESSELVIEVTDAFAEFPHFEELTSDPDCASVCTGLRWLMRHRVRLSWEALKSDEGEVIGKTVKAIVPVSKSEETA
ncbi:hypothetical protein ACWERY_10625 [Streptomyces sp. NPDC004082]|uniref:hypothetical protein n=1 Tax=unclassified Streptomyces TaxID=2593676 RepID=UPI00339F3BA6